MTRMSGTRIRSISARFAAAFAAACCLVASCTSKDLLRIDEAIKNSDKYHNMMLDSLERLKAQPSWDNYVKLTETYSHFQLDSCHRYCLLLEGLLNGDPGRTLIYKTRLARIYLALGNNYDAAVTFKSIDTSSVDMRGDLGEFYYSSGCMVLGNSPDGEWCRKCLGLYPDTYISAVQFKHSTRVRAGMYEEDISALNRFLEKKDMTKNEYTRCCSYLARDYEMLGDYGSMLHYYAESIRTDMELSVKNYNSLYNLATYLYKKGDYRRAGAYIKKSVADAEFCNHPTRLRRNSRSELILSESLQKNDRMKHHVLVLVFATMLMFVILLSIFLHHTHRYSRRLEEARDEISDLSNIKDGFLAQYMELSADYIRKADQQRSLMRSTARKEGTDALLKMLRSPSFTDREYSTFLENFDNTFRSIYPDFIDKVNTLMQPGFRFRTAKEGCYTSELRMLALIRLGITDRARIAKILNISTPTIYTYHSTIQSRSICGNEFDKKVKEL